MRVVSDDMGQGSEAQSPVSGEKVLKQPLSSQDHSWTLGGVTDLNGSEAACRF